MARLSKFRNQQGISKLAQPLASDKLLKKCLKLVKKSCKHKLVRRGVKEVQKALRKNQKGICLIAGDISPVDVISHLPAMCEDKDVPYVFVPSKKGLGEACKSKRPTSCVLIMKAKEEDEERQDERELYDDLAKKINKIAPVY